MNEAIELAINVLIKPLKAMLNVFLTAIAVLILTPVLVATLGLLVMVLLVVILGNTLSGQKNKLRLPFRNMSGTSFPGW